MKVVVIGNSGSGKTWLAEQLHTINRDPIISLDAIYWEQIDGDLQKRSCEEKDSLIKKSKKNISWIVEGVYGDMSMQYFDMADFLVWIDIEWEICKRRIKMRAWEDKKYRDSDGFKIKIQEHVEWASEYYNRHDSISRSTHKYLFTEFLGEKICIKTEEHARILVKNIKKQECL